MINRKQISLAANTQEIYLEDGESNAGRIELFPTLMDSAASNLARKFIELAKQGEDISDLTPDKVFKSKTTTGFD